jgi:cellulose synthase/poly-beta-1,6-N-acetylglucosamine synthase-like glycosyltransferase
MKENSKFMYIKNKVTIIIPCYNEEKYISETIKSIVKQNNINGTKVIIADNNSTDNNTRSYTPSSSSSSGSGNTISRPTRGN